MVHIETEVRERRRKGEKSLVILTPCSDVSHGLFRFSGSQVDRTLLHIKV
jgi:hypothetical protein